ncbi:DNRLRE domain-containing protein [Candidatus Amarolinea dominans]|uniref:DNRLRE domain-containing protein n=1 Tax=Candidatus Amarolinea dominans TaxID=3140696 RepID=UPI003137515F|nr:DNRLRE domain-containing protein [Anaerolineae bacterium]
MTAATRLTPLLSLVTLVLLTAAAAPASQPASAQAAPHTIITAAFQQGLAGYSGVRDTWVSSLDWDTPPQHTVNYGQNDGLTLSRNDGDNPLLAFDLTSITANSAILSATLALYNITPAGCNVTAPWVRRAELFQVLRAWDEGNQVESPINAAGKHGATGDNAFDYFPGQGADVPWNARGMAAGSDYLAAPSAAADIINQGWYTWPVTSLVRAWVRNEQPNDGLVLRDASGYQDGNCDWRTFVSSQAADAAHRPILTVTYNPDTPWTVAGPDQVNLSWNGGAVTLDGSASRDRPGGNNATLTFQWRVAQAAYGSALNGALIGTAAIQSFTPDVPGEWDIELTVTNDVGASAADAVHLRLLAIPAGHPRIYLDPAKLAILQGRAVPSNPRWTQLQAEANDPSGEMHAHALVGLLTDSASLCNQAIGQAQALIASPSTYSTEAGDVALVYDWCYGRLSASQRSAFIAYFNAWGDAPHSNDSPGWGNYWPRFAYSFALMGLATYGDNPRAQEWLDEFRYHRYRDSDLPLLDRIAEGGAWPEGMIYDWIANWPRAKALAAWRSVSGEDLFLSSAWYRERLGYLLLHRWPGLADQWGQYYHPYLSTGDTERNRGSIANYERIMSLILIERFPQDALAQQLQAYVSAAPTDNSQSFLYHEEFLWYNPGQAATTPTPLTHLAPGTGTIFMRSGWPDGAADTNTAATYLTFQIGDHFTYHQHYDQNSFTLFKRSDLALDSGVYSGDGLSNHDINYYVRTAAHNTLVVYNPTEDFSSARPDATSNDGGQRTMSPASRSPTDITYFDQHAVHYDTGDLVRFSAAPAFTYALGDATKAYNNPTYNQTMDAGLSGNVAKVSRFQRELAYLRPLATAGPTANDYVVILDRVGVTQAAFSGARTQLLFHTLGNPTVNGSAATISPGETLYSGADLATAVNGDGKLFMKFLLPPARNVRKIGERGVKAFWVNDANYDWHWDSSEPQPRPINDFEDVPYGEWRLALEPADSALNHVFLTVLHPAAAATAVMPTTSLVSGSGLSGAHVADAALNRLLLFSSANDGAPPAGPLAYSFTPTARTLNVLVDLTPGAAFNLGTTFAAGVVTVQLTPAVNGAYRADDQGVLQFTINANGAVCQLTGDFDGDGQVTIYDVQWAGQAWGQPATPRYDLNQDGQQDVVDVMLAAAHWGDNCS